MADFTENKIGRITTAGVITEFTLPTASSGASGIAAGPDGAVWLTEQNFNSHKIGRITTGAAAPVPILLLAMLLLLGLSLGAMGIMLQKI